MLQAKKHGKWQSTCDACASIKKSNPLTLAYGYELPLPYFDPTHENSMMMIIRFYRLHFFLHLLIGLSNFSLKKFIKDMSIFYGCLLRSGSINS